LDRKDYQIHEDREVHEELALDLNDDDHDVHDDDHDDRDVHDDVHDDGHGGHDDHDDRDVHDDVHDDGHGGHDDHDDHEGQNQKDQKDQNQVLNHH